MGLEKEIHLDKKYIAKRLFVIAVIAGIVFHLVYNSGNPAAFYVTASPTTQHDPGTDDINVTVTFYKERYEAIGTISARLIKMNTNGDPNTGGLSAQSNTDVNCTANSDYYSYGLSQYVTDIAGHDLNILEYGYVDFDPDAGAPGVLDNNVGAKFTQWDPEIAYYGHAYNYAGTFTCVFTFEDLPDGIYISAVPFINGLAVSESGYDSDQSGANVEPNAIVGIKTIQASGVTDLNFTDATGQERMYFSIPQDGTNGTAGTDFITVDINAESAAKTPSGASLDNDAPRFSFGSSKTGLTVNNNGNATLRLTYTGFITDEQAQSANLNIWKYDGSSWTKISSGKTVNTDRDYVQVNIDSFSEYAFATDTSTGGTSPTTPAGPGGNGGTGGGETGEATTEVIAENSTTYTPTDEKVTEILSDAGFTPEEIAEALEAMEDIETITFTYQVEKLTSAGGVVSYMTTLTITVENNSGQRWENVKVLATVPKSIAQKASEISSDEEFEVLVEDPVLEFLVPYINPNSSYEVKYSVGKKITDSAFLETVSPVVTEIGAKVVVDPCEGVNCDDGNPCTRDYCNAATGQCVNEALPDGSICPEGTCQAGNCVKTAPQQKPAAMPGMEGFIILIIVVAVIIAGWYFYSKKGREGGAEPIAPEENAMKPKKKA